MKEEGCLWRALGVLTAAGALKTAVLLLRKLRLPDCALVYVEAASSAGFGSPSVSSGTGWSYLLFWSLEPWHRERILCSTECIHSEKMHSSEEIFWVLVEQLHCVSASIDFSSTFKDSWSRMMCLSLTLRDCHKLDFSFNNSGNGHCCLRRPQGLLIFVAPKHSRQLWGY